MNLIELMMDAKDPDTRVRLIDEQILDNTRVFPIAVWGGIPSTAPTFIILWLWRGRETAINCTWPIEPTQCERVNECESGAHDSGHWEAGDGVGFELAGLWRGRERVWQVVGVGM